MTTEEEVRKNTSDIQILTVNLTRVTALMENSEKRIDTLTGVAQDAVNGMNRLNERMSATVGMERDIAAMRELVAEQKGDIRTIRHDLNNALQSLSGIGIVNEKLNEATSAIAAQGAKIEGLESWRDKMDGAGLSGLGDRVNKLEMQGSKQDGAISTAKGLWSFISTPFWCVVSAVAVWVMTNMYGGKNPISGE